MGQAQENLVEKFTSGLDDFDAVFARVPDEGFDWSEKKGDWTIRQIIHHVTEDITVYGFILEQALALPGCKVVFGDFPGNESWADSMGFDQRPVGNALALMHAQRTYFAELISHFPDRWGNSVNFMNQSGEGLGKSSVREMVTMLTDHMQEHVHTIEKIINANQGP
jgi:hypothetical protein